MTKRQIAKTKMLLTLESLLLKTDPAIIAHMPGFENLLTQLQIKLEELNKSAREQQSITGGYKKQKTSSKKHLITTIREVSTRVQAYAWAINDKVLYHKVGASKSAILLMTDASTNAYAQLVLDLATAHHPALAPYGVDIPLLNKLQAAKDDYYKNIPLPRAAKNNRKHHTKQIALLLQELSHLLMGMDLLVRTLEHTHNQFFNHYFNTKKQVSLPSRRLTIHGRVTNEDDKPIGKATIEIPALKKTTKTGRAGGFKFKNIPSGMYQVTFSQIGYTPQTLTVALVKTISKKVNVKLTPLQSITAAS